MQFRSKVNQSPLQAVQSLLKTARIINTTTTRYQGKYHGYFSVTINVSIDCNAFQVPNPNERKNIYLIENQDDEMLGLFVFF